jgi:regulatory protein
VAVNPLDYRAARLAALGALTRRDHASEDLRRKLVDKGYDSALIGELVEQLRAEKLVDDRRFVENFIGSRAARGQGPVRVRAALREIGLHGAWVEEALSSHGDWMAELHEARHKRFGLEHPAHTAEWLRQARFLRYRGFTDAQIRSVLGCGTEFGSDIDPDIDPDIDAEKL